MQRRAFTLIEIMIVVGLIVVLVAIIVAIIFSVYLICIGIYGVLYFYILPAYYILSCIIIHYSIKKDRGKEQ